MRTFIALVFSWLITGLTPSFAGIAWVNCKSTDSGGTSASSQQTAASSITAGNLVYILVGASADCSTHTAIISNLAGDTIVNAFNGATGNASVANGGLHNDTGSAICSGLFYVKNAIGGASDQWTVTWHLSDNTTLVSKQNPSIVVWQGSGQNTTAPLDIADKTGFANVATVVNMPNSGTVTPAVSNEMAVAGVITYAANRTYTYDTGNGWTNGTGCTSPTFYATIQHKIVSSAFSTSVSVNTPNTYMHGDLASFKASQPGGVALVY